MLGRLAAVLLILAPAAALAETGALPTVAAPVPKAPTATTPATVEEPRDIVDAIYKAAAADVKKGRAGPFENRAMREAYFSKGFDVAVTAAETKAAHDGDTVLGFDPISATQDAELKKVTLKTDVLELNRAVVSASFMNHGQPTVVTYDFVKEGGAWKVDDIKGTTEKEAWSVRKILKNPAREPTTLPGMKDAAKAPDASIKVQPPKRPDETTLEKR